MDPWPKVVVLLLMVTSAVISSPFAKEKEPGTKWPGCQERKQPYELETETVNITEQGNIEQIVKPKCPYFPKTKETEKLANKVAEKPEKTNAEIVDEVASNNDVDANSEPVKPKSEPERVTEKLSNEVKEKPERTNAEIVDEVASNDDVVISKAVKPKNELEKVNYAGAQLWKVTTDKANVRIALTRLRRRNLISTWGGNHTEVDVLVKQEALNNVTRVFKRENIQYDVVIEDLQKRIDEENPPLDAYEVQLQNRRGHRMTWKQYHRMDDINGFLSYLAKTYPAFVTVQTIGQSYEGRDIKLLRLSNGNENNKAVFIDGGIHAREWISPATVTYFINQFVENFDVESDDIKNIDWYFVPVVNPDGYEYTHTTDRLWRKNRRPAGGAQICSGTDLNRNFGYHWGGKGASKSPCSEIYCGSKAFSEPESQAISNFINNNAGKFSAYVTYHSYGQYLLYPWGYDNFVPPDYQDLDALGKKIASAIQSTRGTRYSVGSSSGLLYPASGGSDDWAKSVGIKYSYTIELSDTGRYGFVLPTSFIEPVARESLAGLRVLANQLSQE